MHRVPFLFLLSSLLLHPAQALAGVDHRAAVVVNSANPAEFRLVAAALEARGASLPHRFSPDLLVGVVPPGLSLDIPLPDGVSVELVREPEGVSPTTLPRMQGALTRFISGATREGASPDHPFDFGSDLAPTAAGEPDHGPAGAKSAGACGRPSTTSSVLIGSVAVAILMPESTGPMSDPDLEDWSTEDPAYPGEDRRDIVVAEIMEGLDGIATLNPSAGLSFSYDVRPDIPIPYEPIEHDASDRSGWVRATMDQLAFSGFSPTSSMRSYIDSLRDESDTDWGVVAFVMDSLQDPDGVPPNGFPFAYALLGGPYLVMTYDNNGWGIDDMDTVMAHELGHTFHALDEYSSAGNNCSQVAGYLRVENANNDSPMGDPHCLSAVPCIMRANRGSLCEFSRGQLGIRDSDGDGIPDVRDAPPHSRFEETSPLLIETDSVDVVGQLQALALADESPDSPVRFTLNRVSSAEYRVDGGTWLPASADDGSFGDRCESTTLSLAALAEGWHTVELRGLNDVGILEPSPAELSVYVNTDCPDDPNEPDDDAGTAVPRPAGTYSGLHHCAYDEDWTRFYLSEGAALSILLDFDAGTAMSVELLSSSLGVVAASSPVSDSEARLDAVATHDGTHYLRVTGMDELETPYELTIDAECINDRLEPNDTIAAGVQIHPGLHAELVVCAEDADHYALGMQSGESLTASISFDASLGDLDIELLDPAGTRVELSDGVGNDESVMVTPTLEGVYTLRVFGKTDMDGNLYSMDVSATGCLDDLGENDDDAVSTRDLVDDVPIRGELCPGDEDWFRFSLTERSLVELDLHYDAAEGNLDIELHRVGGELVARSVRLDSPEDITAERLQAGDYLVRVFSQWNEGASYTLEKVAADPLLLYVHKDPSDAILTWSDARQECYTYQRTTEPSDFSIGVEELLHDGGEFHTDLEHRDRDVIFDGTSLYCYRILPSDCGASLLGSTKTASPYPVVQWAPGGLATIEYTITAINSGMQDLFGVNVRDDVPQASGTFSVTEIPVGATDASLPAPEGAFSRGQINIQGINIPAGESAVVKWVMTLSPNGSTSEGANVIDNQAVLWFRGGDPLDPGRSFVTDDPATTAFGDDTRVYNAGFTQWMTVAAFWHREVDMDLRVIDPCGNAISSVDGDGFVCPDPDGSTGWLVGENSCEAPAFTSRSEAVSWFQWPITPGDYAVELRYVDSAATNAACGDRGDDDVTLVVQFEDGTVSWRTLSMPEGTDFVRVWDFAHP